MLFRSDLPALSAWHVQLEVDRALETVADDAFRAFAAGVAERARGKDHLQAVARLTEVVDGSMVGPFVVRRLGEPVQVDEAALPLLTLAKVRPGARVVVRDDEDDRVVVVLEGAQESEGVSLPRDVASHVFVQPAEPLTIS